MSGSVSSEIKAEPNLTPLLDVVFQLITFFMLVINFSNDNNDQRVRLPVAASASPTESGPADPDRLVLNIDSDGKLLMNGEAFDTESAMKEIHLQAQLLRSSADRAAKRKGLPKPDENSLPTTVVIRCDKNTHYSQLYRLITKCQSEGFRKFSLKAMNAEG
ncbi:MAG: biopolymer transport protein [Planctomycetota bacterium]|nr:biopolymer transport protein [Planctomycetota bacterium]